MIFPIVNYFYERILGYELKRILTPPPQLNTVLPQPFHGHPGLFQDVLSKGTDWIPKPDEGRGIPGLRI